MNLSLINPFFLVGLLSIALPVIAHLISRKGGLKRRFSAVQFLVSSEVQATRRSKLKDIVLLALRALTVALLVMVFTKPALYTFSAVGAASPRSAAIVLDNSYSMGYGDNFERAKRLATEYVKSLPDGSFAIAVPLVPSGEQRPGAFADKSAVTGDLQDIGLSYSFTDNAMRIEHIYNFLKTAPNEEKEVVLFTDMQKNGWKSAKFSRSWFRAIDVAPESGPHNLAVTATRITETEENTTVLTKVFNYSSEPVGKLLITLSLPDKLIRTHIDVPPGIEAQSKFNLPPGALQQEGAPAKVEITNDELRIDDTRHFVISATKEPEILIVDGDIREDTRLSESFYLSSALETITAVAPGNITTVDNEKFPDVNLDRYDAIFLANLGSLGPEEAGELFEFIGSGGTLSVFLGDRVRSTYYNTVMKDILPAELGLPEEGAFTLAPGEPDELSSYLGSSVTNVDVKKLFSLRPAENAKVLLIASNSFPFLVHKKIGRGTVFLFGSTADIAWNDFPLSTYFLPTIKKIINTSIVNKHQGRDFTVGESVEVEFRGDADTATVEDPNGEEFKVDIERPQFSRTFTPGIYTVSTKGGREYKFAVNIDTAESNLEKISLDAQGAQSRDEKLGLVKVLREIWPYFLWAVLFMLVTESIMAAYLSYRTSFR
ncbi:MAG: BatA domain-containing protein [Candidatus Dadabacteria bacterium]|nr:BatA domain-containing protein [Candidatus Dadabacteria bacterium]